jgi:peptide/nickel transport system substrate-binding protein
MLWTRLLISGPPFLLLALLTVSFATVKMARLRATNSLAIGVSGEPDILNPILATTQMANSVNHLVFNGLIRLNEDLELAPDLAERWEERQISTIFFRSPEAALEAARSLDNLREQWPKWALTKTETREDELRLHFDRPGTRSSREVFAQLDASKSQPLSVMRVEKGSSAAVPPSPILKRSWQDGGRAVELTLACAQDDAARAVTQLVGPELGEKAHLITELPFLDEPEIVFHLRKDICWHDGRPFSADDVAFTFRAIVDDTVVSPRRADYQLVRSFEVVDDRTIRIVYRKPYSFALQSWTIGILPGHLLARQPPASWARTFNRQPIGTGPFRFAEWKTNESISLVKNDRYFRGRPHLERIVFRIIPDRLSMRLAFQTDQIDVWTPDPYSAAQLANDKRFEILSNPALEYHFICWNLGRPMFVDERVRRALAHAIDVDSIIRHLLSNRAVRATGPFVPSMWFFNRDIAPLPFDPELAKQLLTQAGWQRGSDGILVKERQRFHVALVTNNENQTRKDIATLVQSYLREIGVEVEVQTTESTVFISQFVHPRAFDGLVLSWVLQRNDPDQYQIWHSSQTGPGQLNIAGFRNPQADALLEQMRTAYEREQIKSLAATFQKLIYDAQPYAFLYVPLQSTATRRNRFRLKRPTDGGWHEERLQPGKAGLEAEWLCRIPR